MAKDENKVSHKTYKRLEALQSTKEEKKRELDKRLALTLKNMNDDPRYKELVEKVTSMSHEEIDALPEAERERLKDTALDVVREALAKTEQQIKKN